MGHSVEERIEMLKAYACTDAKYARLHKEALVMEHEFELALLDLPDDVQDTAWKYLFHCEAQSERLLELAMMRR